MNNSILGIARFFIHWLMYRYGAHEPIKKVGDEALDLLSVVATSTDEGVVLKGLDEFYHTARGLIHTELGGGE